jgi:hypothetical protein
VPTATASKRRRAEAATKVKVRRRVAVEDPRRPAM